MSCLFGLTAAAGAQRGDGTVDWRGIPTSSGDAAPLRAGARVPAEAKVWGRDGKEQTLSQALGGRATVLIFYPGGWDKAAQPSLSELQRVEKSLAEKGYQVVAVSPDSHQEIQRTRSAGSYTFLFLSDSQAELMRAFGVAYRMDDAAYKSFQAKHKGLDLNRWSGQTHRILPIPSLFVIQKDGTVAAVHQPIDPAEPWKGDEVLLFVTQPR